MRKKLFLAFGIVVLVMFLAACGKEESPLVSQNSTVEITDMAGRKVIIPREISKVYSKDPVGTILIYTFDPDKLVGQSHPSEGKQKYLSEKLRNLPVIGGVSGPEGNSAKLEQLVKSAPDIIIWPMVTGFSDSDIDTEKSSADKLQTQTNIPVVIVNTNLTQLDKTYEFLGKLLKEEERAKEMAEYCSNTLSEVKSMVDIIPEDKRVRVYYAEGIAGLSSIPVGSRHAEVLEFIRGINVVQVPLNPGLGQVTVSLEKVMIWNPEVIITNYPNNKGFLDCVLAEPAWNNIKAVKDRRIYNIPNQPFNWFDRPPSVNRIIGVKWLANLLYPDYVNYDMRSEVTKFYKLFYHYELNDQEVTGLLNSLVWD